MREISTWPSLKIMADKWRMIARKAFPHDQLVADGGEKRIVRNIWHGVTPNNATVSFRVFLERDRTTQSTSTSMRLTLTQQKAQAAAEVTEVGAGVEVEAEAEAEASCGGRGLHYFFFLIS